MKNLVTILIFGLFAASFPMLASAETLVVIVNSKNSQAIDTTDIKNIYTDLSVEWQNNQRIKVYNLPVDNAARETFARHIIGISAQEHAAEEANRKITNTIRNPTYTKTARLVHNKVSKEENAIGYIPKSILKNSSNVRIIMEIAQ